MELRKGVFLRLDEKYYMDYHPWEEFGDLSRADFLTSISNSGPDTKTSELFELDKTRHEVHHRPFRNHGLNHLEGGIGKFKISCPSEIENILKRYGNSNVYRFDLNNGSSFSELKFTWDKLTDTQKHQIEYIEDPFPYNDHWRELFDFGVPLACDRNEFNVGVCDYQIFKPNVDTFLLNSSKKVFSSYMGEDLGRYHAYLSLMLNGDLNLIHGINTPNLFRDQLQLFKVDSGLLNIDISAVNTIYKKFGDLEWINLI
jgi:hypothetical protein